MNRPEIQERIASGENDKTEFKRGIGDLKPVGRTIAAFANTDGGVLILGVDDDSRIVGVSGNPEAVLERLTGFLQTGLNAPVQARIDRYEDPDGWVVWIEIPRQRGFEPLRHEGRVFVRRARASVEPSPFELQELYNIFGYIVTEERAVDAAGVDAIEAHSFSKYLERLGLDLSLEPQPGLERDLVNRGVLVEIGGALRATLYGLLAFGKTPQLYPQTQSFWIECVSYAGQGRADEVLQVAEGRGRIDEQVDRAVGWIRGLGRMERYHQVRREDEFLLPMRALRESLVNAVVHKLCKALHNRCTKPFSKSSTISEWENSSLYPWSNSVILPLPVQFVPLPYSEKSENCFHSKCRKEKNHFQCRTGCCR
jgi:ATP-dependent DNA helicase RecG